MGVFPLDQVGASQVGPKALRFGLLLPWVTPANGQSVDVLLIHEQDQFLQSIPAVTVPMQHSVHPDYGDLWSVVVDLTTPAALPAQATWGQPGRYVYRFAVSDPGRGRIDWVIDPCARDFGFGKQSAVVLDGQPYTWSATEAAWRVPALRDLVMYELNVAEFNVDLAGAVQRLDYLADLGVNCLSIMPVANIASQVDWGYLPVGYFGVDDRFGGNDAFRALVEAAHARGLAVIVDSVYGHASRALFGYQYVYDRLGYQANPFMGPFAQDLFAAQGASIDYTHPLVQDFFAALNQYWLGEFHVDGFRYDCVPNYWDGPTGVGYAKVVFDTRSWVAGQVAAVQLARFDGAEGLRLIQCAEQLEDAVGVLWQSASDTTWQDGTLNAARDVAHGGDGAINRFAASLGLSGFPVEVPMNNQVLPRTALQYLETHDHSRLLAEFGTVQNDDAGNYLFLAGDRSLWYKLQPYLIGLLTAKGIPMLFEGEELGEDFTLPGSGLGRIGLLRPVNWDYFYDDPGRALVGLVRRLLRLRRERAEMRGTEHWFYDDAANYQNRGLMICRRDSPAGTSVVAVNFSGTDATVGFTFPAAGQWIERLDGVQAVTAVAGQPSQITVPSNYGRIWTMG